MGWSDLLAASDLMRQLSGFLELQSREIATAVEARLPMTESSSVPVSTVAA
jgi:hypothetical protein